MSLPPCAIPQNVGFVPIWLIIGIILIIIALSGLLWRYFHPKYVPPEEKDVKKTGYLVFHAISHSFHSL